jgi:hypothetical protein
MNHPDVSARHTRLQRAGIAAAALGAALGATIGAVAAPASAGQVPTAQSAPTLVKTVTLPAGTKAADIQGGGAQATVIKLPETTDATINCTIRVGEPRYIANHGNVVVTSAIRCSAPVARLTMNIRLLFNDNLVASVNRMNQGRASLQGHVVHGCFTGAYQGVAGGNINYPAGFNPPTGGLSVLGFHRFIVC